MAKQYSWADRRWKIFEQTYNSSAELREELSKIKITVNGDTFKGDENVVKVGEILAKYKVPAACLIAAAKFLVNPNLDRYKYLKEVLPPFLIWGTNNMGIRIGREIFMPKADWIEMYFGIAEARGTIDKKDRSVDYEEISKALSSNPLIEIMPGTNKTELKDFIDECWDDISQMIREVDPDSEVEYHYSERLLGKVQPSKTKRHAERDELIAQLYNEHESDYSIRILLREQGYGDLDENNIKQIRYKLGLTKKHSSKPKS